MRLFEFVTISVVVMFMGVGWHGEATAEVFTSTEMIRAVIVAQEKMASELKTYISREKDRIAMVKRLVENFEKDSTMAENELLDLMSNPVEIYRAVRQYQRESLGIDNLLGNKEIANETVARLQMLAELMPSKEDYIGSIQGLLRLQETYALDTRDLIDGRLGGDIRNASKLHIDDMFEIGRTAYSAGDYKRCAQWMTEAIERLPTEGTAKTKVDRATLLDYLSFANYKLGNIQLALDQTLEFLQYEPNHERGLQNAQHYKHLVGQLMPKGDMGDNNAYQPPKQMPPTPEQSHHNSAEERYKLLCRGEKIMQIQDEHYLHCDYANNNDPRLLIAPLKRETLHFDPLIVIYYDVISDKEIKFVKKTALPKLNRATTRNKQTGMLDVVDYRITKTAWIANGTDDYFVPRLNRRVSQMTQLNMETVEEFQVANYGIGGYYAAHLDHSDTEIDEDDAFSNGGNRIATLMFYLSNVRAGGATVFPDLGLTAWPKKGSAIFWFNLYKSGKSNRRLLHAACPVVYGNKWVMNKWFHIRSQELWHPCSTDPGANFSLHDLEGDQPITYQREFGRLR